MEKEGRNNSILLTVIAIATLLVTVAGATFAYFTAVREGNETGSTIIVTTGGGASFKLETTNIEIENVYPQDGPLTETPKYISFTNETPNTMANDITYSLYLRIDKEDTMFKSGALSYTLTRVTDNSVCVSGEADCANKVITATGRADDLVGEVTTPTKIVYTTEATDMLNTYKVAIGDGTGKFVVGSNGEVHVYALNIYFPNDTEHNQNDQQNRTFTAYVGVEEVK